MSESSQVPNWQSLPFFAAESERLADLVEWGRLPQVMLFEGRRGLGKRMFAARVAAMPFCTKKTGCGSCGPCLEIIADQHPEFLWIESSAGKLKLEDAQKLQDHLAVQPASGFVRTVVVARCEELLKSAANRLLKTLEEPPVRSRIIMTTDARRSLLPTIVSRTVRMRLVPPGRNESMAYLTRELPKATSADCERALLATGQVPLAAAKLLARGDGNNGDDTGEDWWELDPITAGERLARKKDLNLAHIFNRWEQKLSERYRRRGADLSPAGLAARRTWARQVRAVAVRAKVAINKQLLVEQMLMQQELK